MGRVQRIVGNPHKLLDRVSYPFDGALDGGEHRDERDRFRGEDQGRSQPVEHSENNLEEDFNAAHDQKDPGSNGHDHVEQRMQVHSFGAHDGGGMRARVRAVLHDASVDHRVPDS